MRLSRRRELDRLGRFRESRRERLTTALRGLPWLKVLIGATAAATLFVIMYSGLEPPSVEWAQSQLAPVRVIASRRVEVVDEDETEKRRQDARAKVPRQYRALPEAAAEARQQAEELFQSITDARLAAAGLDPEQSHELIRDALALDVDDAALSASLSAPRQTLAALRRDTFDIVARQMRRDIRDDTPDDPADDAEQLLEPRFRAGQEAQALSHDRGLQALAEAIAIQVLRPNSEFDEAETSRLRTEAAAAIPEVKYTFERGKPVVERHEIVKYPQFRALELLGETRPKARAPRAASLAAILSALVLMVGLYLKRVCPDLFANDRMLIFLAVCVTVYAVICQRGASWKYFEVSCLSTAAGLAAVIAVLMRLRTAAIMSLVMGLLAGLISPAHEAHLVVAVALAGMAASYAVAVISRRGEIVTRTVPLVALCNAVLVYLYLSLDQSTPEISDVVWGAAGGALAAIAAIFIQSCLDRPLGVTTNLRLVQLDSPTTPILRRLAIEAPGTFAHTMAVANLVQAASEAVGGNVLLARVGAYYHDIGKLKRPHYFVENQAGGVNPHDDLEPPLSARVIVAHVKDGIELARHLGLPAAITDFVPMHHGTTVIPYFYTKEQELTGEDVPEESFRYPGPKPRTRETAILMFADTVEAAARTMGERSPAKLETMISRTMQRKIDDGQLEECAMTLADLERIKQAFLRSLAATHHKRVRYPEQETDEHLEPDDLPSAEHVAHGPFQIAIVNRQQKRVDRKPLRDTVKRVLTAEGVATSADITIVLVDDAEISEYNERFRAVEGPTDVLAFDMNKGEEHYENGGTSLPRADVWGDILISVDTAERQAAAEGHGLAWELAWLVAHGVLHICGHEDKTEEQLALMQERQTQILGPPPQTDDGAEGKPSGQR